MKPTGFTSLVWESNTHTHTHTPPTHINEPLFYDPWDDSVGKSSFSRTHNGRRQATSNIFPLLLQMHHGMRVPEVAYIKWESVFKDTSSLCLLALILANEE